MGGSISSVTDVEFTATGNTQEEVVLTPTSLSITQLGSPEIAVNDFHLVAAHLAPDRFGYFLMSETQGFVPLFGGGAGNLCLGAPVVRLSKPPSPKTNALEPRPGARPPISWRATQSWPAKPWIASAQRRSA